MKELLHFLARLEDAKVAYVLGHFRDTINVQVAVPGERWEVEFFADGAVQVEIFRSDGRVTAGAALVEKLFAEHSA